MKLPIECFARAPAAPPRTPLRGWPHTWRAHLAQAPLALADGHGTALARIVPFLICGEQSAIRVFASAAGRCDQRARWRSAFLDIERDESGHEAAWQALLEVLPRPRELQRLKRRAALFFTRLGRAHSVGEHFARIAHLDTAVGVMMWHLERSAVAAEPRIAALAGHVKRDEARHVSVSKRYVRDLGVPRERYEALGAEVRDELVATLAPVAEALEGIGIDTDRMFLRVQRGDRST